MKAVRYIESLSWCEKNMALGALLWRLLCGKQIVHWQQKGFRLEVFGLDHQSFN